MTMMSKPSAPNGVRVHTYLCVSATDNYLLVRVLKGTSVAGTRVP